MGRSRPSCSRFALEKLAEKGFFKITPIKKIGNTISTDGPCPVLYIGVYIVALGGTDKTHMPGEVRIVADSGLPHADAKDSFKINAPADTGCFPPASGEQDKIIKFNDLTGPKGGAKPDYVSPDPRPQAAPIVTGDHSLAERLRLHTGALSTARRPSATDPIASGGGSPNASDLTPSTS